MLKDPWEMNTMMNPILQFLKETKRRRVWSVSHPTRQALGCSDG